MAVKEFEKPELKDYSPIPKLVEEATSHLAPFKSKVTRVSVSGNLRILNRDKLPRDYF